MPNVSTAVAVAHGEKTIKFDIRFWTDGLAPARGQVRPRHMHGSGWVIVHNQPAHGITYTKVPFNSMAEIPAAIERAIMQCNITVVNTRREEQYRMLRTGNIYDWPERELAS